MNLETALLSAVAALASVVVALFWLYIRQRDANDSKYEKFTGQMLPLLTELKTVAAEMNGLARQILIRFGGPTA